jgi:hypothetical protein
MDVEEELLIPPSERSSDPPLEKFDHVRSQRPKSLARRLVQWALSWYTLGVLAFVLLLLLILGTFRKSPAGMDPEQMSHSGKGSYCGNSTSEARALGCRFDPMSFNWLPPDCYDEELITEFLAVDKWVWYKDNSTATAMPFSEVQSGEYPRLWVTRKFHLYHCTYQWRKFHRAILMGKPVDDYVGKYDHTAHCEGVLTEDPITATAFDDVGVRINRKFVGCGHNGGRKDLYSAQQEPGEEHQH